MLVNKAIIRNWTTAKKIDKNSILCYSKDIVYIYLDKNDVNESRQLKWFT